MSPARGAGRGRSMRNLGRSRGDLGSISGRSRVVSCFSRQQRSIDASTALTYVVHRSASLPASPAIPRRLDRLGLGRRDAVGEVVRGDAA